MKSFACLFLPAWVLLASAGSAWPKHSRSASARGTRVYNNQPSSPRARGTLSHAQSEYYKHHKRNRAAEEAFERHTGYPHERRGYVVDHIIPLACGGADAPSNMEWQTISDAKAKDKWERKGCKR